MAMVILTGGGTAGHVTPNLALVPGLAERGISVRYIGSKNGMEKELVSEAGIPYDGISVGKLRRYFSLKNFTDPFRVLAGISQAKKLMKRYRPAAVFSKGGFVSLPVVIAASRKKIPVILHESDMTPGLANRLCLRYAKTLCCNFPETVKTLPEGRAVLTGCPIRAELLSGSREEGLKMTGFTGEKPVLLVIGGSLGSEFLNETVRAALPALLAKYDVVHLTGAGRVSKESEQPGYVQFEYVKEPLRHLFALADTVISRAGANAICELLALKKPALLIPLSRAASRGDQILNARSFAAQGFSIMKEEEDVTAENLPEALAELEEQRDALIGAMSQAHTSDGTKNVLALIEKAIGSK